MRFPSLVEVLLCVLVTAILGAILWPVHGGSYRAPTTACLSNVKQMGVGVMIYMGDSDDRYPRRDFWMDEIVPYTKNESIFHCSIVPKAVYGYAFNSRLSGAKPPKQPEATVMLFESVNPIRNASDPLLSLPNPGRHPGGDPNPKTGRNNVGYADGHAKMFPGGVVP